MSNRLNGFIVLDKETMASVFSLFDNTATILDFVLIENSMSNTGYAVTTTSGKYFLKLYSNTTDKIEAAVYSYLEDKINVPKLYYFDGSKQRFNFSYTITEYIKGNNLKDYIRSNGEYKSDIVYEIGRMCGILHQKKYDHDAWLNPSLNEEEIIPQTHEHIIRLLVDKAGEYLKAAEYDYWNL